MLLIAAAIIVAAQSLVPPRAKDHTVTIPVCARVPIPGRAFTLNPYAPKSQQMQLTRMVCANMTFPDPGYLSEHYAPITDFRHDPRAFA